MNKPLVVDFLKTRSFNDLFTLHGVNVRMSTCGTKVSLNYDQIAAKNGDPLAEQCRGLVLRLPIAMWNTGNHENLKDAWKCWNVGECQVLAWPMNRFYNHGDQSVKAAVDMTQPDKLSVLEKLDGTMIVMYYDALAESWCAATRAVPDADLPFTTNDMEAETFTFSELFADACTRAVERQLSQLPGSMQRLCLNDVARLFKLHEGTTYVFELTTPHNRVVVKYIDHNVTLLAMRDLETGLEFDLESAKQWLNFVSFPRSYSLGSIQELIDYVNKQDPQALEGVVVMGPNFERVKVKSVAWVLSSKAKDLLTTSRRRGLEAILNGTIDDVIPIVDKATSDALMKMRDDVNTFVSDIDTHYRVLREGKANVKEFALAVQAAGAWSGPMFAMWHGKATSTADWLVKHSTPTALDHILEAFSNKEYEPSTTQEE